MTTTAPDRPKKIDIAPEEFQPPFELPPINKVTFLNLRRRTDTYAELFKSECPHIRAGSLDDEKLLALGIEGVDPDMYIRDPDVLWVGRLLDGFVALGLFSSRSFVKNMLKTVTSGRTTRPPGLPGTLRGGGEVGFSITPVFRAEMYESLQKGQLERMSQQVLDRIKKFESPEIALGEPIKHNEPGEVRNSPVFDINASLTEDEMDDMWASQMASDEWDPKMRRDTRFGLHYLKRGDRIDVNVQGFPRPSTEYTEHTWILRPLSEGSSYVATQSGDPGTVNLT